MIGQGLVSCVAAWNVAKPQVVVMHGAATDNNATLFAQGYNAVLKPLLQPRASGPTWPTRPDTWDPPTAATEFEEAYTAHPNINAALIPNDETGAPIITYLKTLHVKPKTFPTTGQDATLTGLQNILSGYQCGTVYKPIYLEAQAAVALALYLRDGKTPPAGLVNGTTEDTDGQRRGAVGPADPGVGHDGQHERHDHQGQLRAGVAALRRYVRGRVHVCGDHFLARTLPAIPGVFVVTCQASSTSGPPLPHEREGRTWPQEATAVSAGASVPEVPAPVAAGGQRRPSGPCRPSAHVDLDVPPGAGDRPGRRQRRRQVGPHQDHLGTVGARRRCRSCGKGDPSTSTAPKMPRRSGSRRSTRTSPCATTSTSSRTCSSATSRCATGCSTRRPWSWRRGSTLDDLQVTTVRSIRQPVASLSGGQRQSVAVAKAVMSHAKLVIMDEPTAALGVSQTAMVLESDPAAVRTRAWRCSWCRTTSTTCSRWPTTSSSSTSATWWRRVRSRTSTARWWSTS